MEDKTQIEKNLIERIGDPKSLSNYPVKEKEFKEIESFYIGCEYETKKQEIMEQLENTFGGTITIEELDPDNIVGEHSLIIKPEEGKKLFMKRYVSLHFALPCFGWESDIPILVSEEGDYARINVLGYRREIEGNPKIQEEIENINRICEYVENKRKNNKRTTNRGRWNQLEIELLETPEEGKKEDLLNKKEAYEIIDKSGKNYLEVEEKMPEFFDELMNDSGKFIDIDTENNIGVILRDESHYYGSGGCEYGVNVVVMRDGKTDSIYFKWRDPYNPKKDNRNWYFDEAEIIDFNDEEVEVTLNSGTHKTKFTFSLPKQEKINLENRLTKEEQKAWMEGLNKEKERLLDAHYRENAIMPDYIDYRFHEGVIPNEFTRGRMVGYEKPTVVDKLFDKRKGLGAIVIKAQIDHCAGFGKQYEWVGYVFNEKGESEQVFRDCAYELELRKGKRIEVKARELIK